MRFLPGLLSLVLLALPGAAQVVYPGGEGPGAGKHVVLISGDEEYRSEEMLPQLGKILATHHGFKCTIVFPINPDGGYIDPNHGTNIPGLEALDTAELMVIFTRFRALPDAQMQHIDNYLRAGKPVIGIRTATHAFKFPEDSPWAHYSDSYRGDKSEWRDGFGKLVLGEKWVAHHGEHKHESTRGRTVPDMRSHPILRGIDDGAIWGPSDVYTIRRTSLVDLTPLVLGEVVARAGDYDEAEPFYGMRETDTTPVEGRKNDPMMPIAWTRTYQLPDGEAGKVFTSTIGSSTDFADADYRRLLVNAVYWATGLEEAIPAEGTNAELVGEYAPSAFQFHDSDYWKSRAVKPESLE